MKLSKPTLTLLCLAAFHPAVSFTAPHLQNILIVSSNNPRISILRATPSKNDEGSSSVFDSHLQQTKLKEAVQYLKENPDTNISRERWNQIFVAIEERTLHAEENTENLRMEFPLESAARQEMTDMYETLRQQNKLTLYGAIPIDQPLAAGGHLLPASLLEEILNLPMKALTPQPTNSLLIAGASLAVAEAVTSFVSGISFNALFLLTLFSVAVDRLFLNGAVSESFLKLFSPGIQSKILRHEAGHFLAAYLLGCPVEGIVLSAWAALQDRRFGTRQVSAGTSFFDPELSQQINAGGYLGGPGTCPPANQCGSPQINTSVN